MNAGPSLLATSDLHVNRDDNEALVRDLHPQHPGDWLIVAGDVGDRVDTVSWTLGLLAERFARVIWVPGNHELWTTGNDPVTLVGPARYEHLVDVARGHGVLTPEDPWPVWDDPVSGPVRVCPLFVLYDYSVRPPSMPVAMSNAAALEQARDAGVVCTDEVLMRCDPHPDAAAWCAERLAITRTRLEEARAERDLPTVLVNHWPLTPEPTRILWYPEFALWCGTTGTADWHVRHGATCVVYGHLHIPRTTVEDGVRFEEVSVGYPREWQRHGLVRGPLRTILPAPTDPGPDPFTAWAAQRRASWARTP